MTTEELQRINQLIAANCPYLMDGKEIPMRTAVPVPLLIERYRSFEERPVILAEWMKVCIELYRKSLDIPELLWLRDLIEKDSTSETIKWSRAFAAANLITPPCFARPDMPRWDKICEVQVPGSGYGLITIFNPELAAHTRDIYSEVTGSSNPQDWLYLYFNPNMLRDTQFFCEQVGMDLAFRKLPPDWGKYRLVRRQFLHQMVELPRGTEVLAAALEGRIIIDPPPCLLFDQKLPMTFPSHPLLHEHFLKEMRTLFPASPLLDGSLDNPLNFSGETLTARDIIRLPRSERDFILKYGGTDPWLRFGGHGVHRIKKLGHDKVAEQFIEAMNSGQPWIIQRGTFERNIAVFLNDNGSLDQQEYYTLWRPVYSLYPNPCMVALVVYLAPSWKVHGTSEALITTQRIMP